MRIEKRLFDPSILANFPNSRPWSYSEGGAINIAEKDDLFFVII